MLQKMVQIGNSVGIIVPKDMLKTLKLTLDSQVHVAVDPSVAALIISKKEKPYKGMSVDVANWTKQYIKANRDTLEELAHA